MPTDAPRPGIRKRATDALVRRLTTSPRPADVVVLYEVLLGRPPESSAVIAEVRRLPWVDAVRGIVASDEFRARNLRPEPTDLERVYEVLLGRPPESAAVIDDLCRRPWVEVVCGIVESEEFHKRKRHPDATDVDHLYESFLGRAPESRAIVDAKTARAWPDLVDDMLASEEFATASRLTAWREALDAAERFDVQDEASPDELESLFRQMSDHWRSLGSQDETAYWSVLTEPRFKDGVDPEGVEAFYATGAQSLDILLRLAEHARKDLTLADARVLDFGCGVGRVFAHVAGVAAWSEGWDFSATHIGRLEERLRAIGAARDRWAARLIESPHLPSDAGFDLIFSLMTLQHNPPPLMAHLTRELIRLLDPGGVAVLHIPTAPLNDAYSFSLRAYRPTREIEMHALPKRRIYDIAAEGGAAVVDSRYVAWSGPEFLSELIVLRKQNVRR